MTARSVFDWNNGQPSIFSSDRAMNGVNAAIAAKARAAKDAKALIPTGSINTEIESEQGKRFRLRRRSQ